MTPAYQDDYVTLHHADARQLPACDAEFDVMVTDPPYDPETHDGAKAPARPDYGVGFLPLDAGTLEWLTTRRIRRWQLAFCSLEMLGTYRVVTGDWWVRAGVWDRVGGAPQFSGDRPAQGAEGIAIWHRPGKKRWNGGGRRALWTCSITRKADRIHETQKPLTLMLMLVADFTEPGETVFDPFAGSCTTGVAAKMYGRKAVLVEWDGARIGPAIERLKATEVDERLAGFTPVRQSQQVMKW